MATHPESLLAANSKPAKYTIPKNLVLVIGGILVVLVVIILVAQTMFGNPVAPKQKLTPQADTSQAPAPETIDRISHTQQEAARKQLLDASKNSDLLEKANQAKESNNLKQNLPFPSGSVPSDTFPTVDGNSGKVNLPKPGSPNSAAVVDPRIEAAARENLLRSSAILAINDSGSSVDQYAGAAKKAVSLQSNGLSASEDDEQKKSLDKMNGLLGQTANMSGLGQQTSQTKAKSESDWMKETATVTRGHEVLHGYSPPSRYVLQQGRVINVVSMTAINTDLPGEVQARVLMDVYDSIVGNTLLIPKGSVVVGQYNSDIRVGQERVNMAFLRIMLPNGLSVDLTGNSAMDASGRTGIAGDVNNHYGQMFFVSTLTAIGSYAAASSVPASSGVTVLTGSGAATNAAGQIFGDINKAVIERNKVIAPTITIPSGISFVINVKKDIELPPFVR